ncbi:hypothetical protein GLIP_2792 [Aliiglaciecola lipolytica E3]|uniref:Uncharacterized protein n=1 Tax=Aliiglaciecola lipolytica E3 TaxID=1127673 RepID=K6YFL6_9ALTE|nr:hypothetical protein GLIP_2792 [Aliiglaciecola lipolytica E3]
MAEIVILVTTLRSSFAQYLLSDIQNKLTQIMTDISMKMEQTQLDDVRYSLAPYTGQMREFQRDYIMQITDSSENLENFHAKYCIKREINPYVNGSNLELVCHTIRNSTLLEIKNAS